jgi:hypothetical protein
MGPAVVTVYITENTEYHLRGRLCVGVLDRASGRFLDDHRALGERLWGAVRFDREGRPEAFARTPSRFDSLLFRTPARDVLTSAVVHVRRPKVA